MLILEAYALKNRIISFVPLHNKRPCLNILQLTWKRYNSYKTTFRRFLFLGSAISPFWKISTCKVSVLFLSIASQIALSSEVKAACLFTLIPWCHCALILFCEFEMHQHVFWQKLQASFAAQKHQLFLKRLYRFLTFKRKEEKLETSTFYLHSGQKLMPWAGVVSTATNTM